ncbi:murein hydrolase activator EnvC family protein [Paracoccus aerius]
MRFLIPLALAALVLAAPVPAQEPSVTAAVSEAQDAAAQLRAAVAKLADAVSADDQVTALTEVIRGYEQGLSALRDGLRQASAREAELRARFESQRGRLASVLGAMTALQQAPETTMLLHPAGALANARSGMVLSDVTPACGPRPSGCRTTWLKSPPCATCRQARRRCWARGLPRCRKRAACWQAPSPTDQACRCAMPMPPPNCSNCATPRSRWTNSRQGFPGCNWMSARRWRISRAPRAPFRCPPSAPSCAFTASPTPRASNGPAGSSQPPAALVTTPWSATIRYRGPLLDYGNVMIVEPARGYLLVFAGMSQVFGEVGDVLQAGDPIGLMGGTEAPAQEFGAQFVTDAAIGGNAGQTESLYLELRKGQETLDPAEWFVLNPVVEPEQD